MNNGYNYLNELIVSGANVQFDTPDGTHWQMRQPTSAQMSDAYSAYKLQYDAIMDDVRLRELAYDETALQSEAHKRGIAAQIAYILPLLLCDERGMLVYDVHNPASLAEFEELPADAIAEMAAVFFGVIMGAIDEAKKKPHKDL